MERVPGIFSPDKVLESCFNANPVPKLENLKATAFIGWVSIDERAQYFDNARKQLTKQRVDNLKRKTW